MASREFIFTQSGEWRVSPFHLTHRALYGYLAHIASALLISIACLIILLPLAQSGYPWASDSFGHLQRAEHMANSIRSLGLIDGFTSSAWMPDWYMGDPTRVYYPPMANWVLGLTATVIPNITNAYRVFVTGILLTLGLSTYGIGFIWGRNRLSAIVGAILIMSAPYTLRTIFVEGNFARALAILPLPYLFYFHERLLTERKIRKLFIMIALAWAFAIVAHVQQAVLFAYVLALYVAIRVVMNEYIPIRRTFIALFALGIGGILAMFYILPAYGKSELGNVPYLPDKIDLFSVQWSAVIPIPETIEAITLGTILIVFAVLYVLRFGKQHQKAMVIIASVSVLLAFGEKAGLYLFLPLRDLILPERFLNVTAVVLPLAIASTSSGGISRRWLVVGLTVVLCFDFLPVWRVVHMRPAPDDLMNLARISANRPYEGRSVPLINPSPSSQHIYATSVTANRDSVQGWALENTPQHQGIRRLGRALDAELDYLPAMLSLWNTDYILTLRDTQSQALRNYYYPIASDGDYKLWERSSPSSFAYQLPDNPMLVIGDNPSAWMFMFPFASEGYSPKLSDYTPEYLERFSVIGLNRMNSPNLIEETFGDWIADGGTLVMDLSNLPAPYNSGFDIFGVQTFSFVLDQDYPINRTITDFPNVFDLPDDIPRWVGSTYYGLDGTLLSVVVNGEIYPMLGYKQVGQGRVWFVGFNLLYWLELQGDFELSETIVSVILEDEDVYRELIPVALDIQDKQYQAGKLSFDYTLDTDRYVILSQTYFPRWQATVDGQPIEIENHQHLIGLELPAGAHQVELVYQPYSDISMLGFGVSGLGLLSLAGMWFLLRREAVLTVQNRISDFFDRHDYGFPPVIEAEEYEVCPNCGRQTARTLPPTQATYPFFVTICDTCGYDTSHGIGKTTRRMIPRR